MTKEAKKSSHGEQESRFVITGYVCANCDTDFGENEFGCMVEDGIQTTSCPICGCNILYVYHMVSHDRRQIPAPTMSKEVLDLLRKQKDNRFFQHVVPADGMHGVESFDVNEDDYDYEEQAGCGGDNDECCCPTRGDYCITDLDAQVAEERKCRHEEFERVLKCLRDTPVMEE